MLRSELKIDGVVSLGALDPDSSAGLTARLGAHNKADKLIERHAANWPEELRQLVSLPLDELRTDALDLQEVHDALSALKGRKAFFDPDADYLLGAAVRGIGDAELWVSVRYQVPSGRVGQGVIRYEGLAKSEAGYEKLRKQAQERIWGSQGESPAVGQPTDAEIAAAGIPEDEAAERISAAEQAAREAEEKAAGLAEELEKAQKPEPFEGYADLNAKDAITAIKEGGVHEYGISGLERIQDYEESHENRKTVLDAIVDVVKASPRSAD